MGLQDTAILLQRIAQAYPEAVLVDDVMAHVESEGSRRVARAVRALFEGGLIAAGGTPCVDGVPGSELRLAEPGIAVACGLVRIEDDPSGAITVLEAHTVGLLQRARQRPSASPRDRPSMPAR